MEAGGFSDADMEVLPVDLTRPTIDHLAVSCAENFKDMVGTQWIADKKDEDRCGYLRGLTLSW